MKRIHTLIGCGVAAVASCAALAAPLGAQAATVETGERMVGGKMQPILVTESGLTLYTFTADKKHKDKCVEIMGCTTAWPPLTVMGMPTGSENIKSTWLGTTLLPNMEMQVTFKKKPLYTYYIDKPGEVGYVGAFAFTGYWDAVGAKGKTIK
jgi:predicted lipoprotein with Yx(FWY)xxD motif